MNMKTLGKWCRNTVALCGVRLCIYSLHSLLWFGKDEISEAKEKVEQEGRRVERLEKRQIERECRLLKFEKREECLLGVGEAEERPQPGGAT